MFLQIGIRGEACYNNNSMIKLTSFNATRNGAPNFQPMAKGITLKEAYIPPSGGVVCKYTRVLQPPMESQYLFYNLQQPHHVVYAFGQQLGPSNYPGYHTFGKYNVTSTPVSFVQV